MVEHQDSHPYTLTRKTLWIKARNGRENKVMCGMVCKIRKSKMTMYFIDCGNIEFCGVLCLETLTVRHAPGLREVKYPPFSLLEYLNLCLNILEKIMNLAANEINYL